MDILGNRYRIYRSWVPGLSRGVEELQAGSRLPRLPGGQGARMEGVGLERSLNPSAESNAGFQNAVAGRMALAALE